MSKYSQKLKDPRWQKKRKEILNRDWNICQECAIDYEEQTYKLHVHHKKYISGNDPWEYKNDDLITVCERCHENIHFPVDPVVRDVVDKLCNLFVMEKNYNVEDERRKKVYKKALHLAEQDIH